MQRPIESGTVGSISTSRSRVTRSVTKHLRHRRGELVRRGASRHLERVRPRRVERDGEAGSSRSAAQSRSTGGSSWTGSREHHELGAAVREARPGEPRRVVAVRADEPQREVGQVAVDDAERASRLRSARSTWTSAAIETADRGAWPGEGRSAPTAETHVREARAPSAGARSSSPRRPRRSRRAPSGCGRPASGRRASSASAAPVRSKSGGWRPQPNGGVSRNGSSEVVGSMSVLPERRLGDQVAADLAEPAEDRAEHLRSRLRLNLDPLRLRMLSSSSMAGRAGCPPRAADGRAAARRAGRRARPRPRCGGRPEVVGPDAAAQRADRVVGRRAQPARARPGRRSRRRGTSCGGSCSPSRSTRRRRRSGRASRG